MTANLTLGTATGDGTDILQSIESLVGSGHFSDNLTGDGGPNGLRGRGGNDTLTGLAGADRLIGYRGDDTAYGGAGRDVLLGNQGADLLDGPGIDHADGGAGTDTCHHDDHHTKNCES